MAGASRTNRIDITDLSVQGLHMPAEWAKHDACWIAWPSKLGTWAYPWAHHDPAMTKRHFAGVAQAIACFEPVMMLAAIEDIDEARQLCGPTVDVRPLPVFGSWTRDAGPTFVMHGSKIVAVNWCFNNYGVQFGIPAHEYAADTCLATRIAAVANVPRVDAPLILEGGAIHTDGEGTMLVTESCLLHPNRNPHFGKADYEHYFRTYLGIEKTIWLAGGLVHDTLTMGHVDTVACFASPGVVLAHVADPGDLSHDILKRNLEILHTTTDARGRQFKVIELPLVPTARQKDTGEFCVMSYANFYIANGGVVMPAFDIPDLDRRAYEIVSKAFPGREVLQVPALGVAVGGGVIHCITQQQPAG